MGGYRDLQEDFEMRKRIIYYAIGLIAMLSAFLFLAEKKDIWFCDEVFTYESANGFTNLSVLADENVWHTGTDIKAYFAANEVNPRFGEIADRLYTDHVPLYFWLFRIASIINMGSCTKWIGLSINLIFYFLLFFVLWKFFGDIGESSELGKLLAVGVILLHPLVLSEALTIRMYLMFSLAQMTFLTVLDKDDMCPKRVAGLSLTAMAGMLTHYYFWIWLGLFSIGYLIYLAVTIPVLHNKLKAAGIYIGAMLLSLAGTTLLFPKWIKNIFFDAGTKGHSSLLKILTGGGGLLKEFWTSVANTCTQLTTENGVTVPLIFLFIVLILYFFARKGNYKIWLMMASGILYAVFITHTQPTAEGRYLWSSSVLLLIAFVYMLTEVICFMYNKALRHRKRVLVCCLAVFLAADVYKFMDTNNISYLQWRPKEQAQAVKAEVDCPWIVFYNDIDWILMCSMMDFTTPKAIKRVGTQTPGTYDKLIQETDHVIVYTNESAKNIDQCLQYLKDSCDKEIDSYERISDNYLMSVYRVSFK